MLPPEKRSKAESPTFDSNRFQSGPDRLVLEKASSQQQSSTFAVRDDLSILHPFSASHVVSTLCMREENAVLLYRDAYEKLSYGWPIDEFLDIRFRHQLSVIGLQQQLGKLNSDVIPSTRTASELRKQLRSFKGKDGILPIVTAFLKREQRCGRIYRQILSESPSAEEFHLLIDQSLLPRILENITDLQQVIIRLQDEHTG